MEETTIKKSFLFISCEEAYYICDKVQYGEANFWDKIKLNLRLMWCSFTKTYVRKNTQLTHMIKTSNLHTLDASERDLLTERFNQHLKNEM